MIIKWYHKVPQSTTTVTSYDCECGKQYKYQSCLSRHKKTCTYEPPLVETETHNQIITTQSHRGIFIFFIVYSMPRNLYRIYQESSIYF